MAIFNCYVSLPEGNSIWTYSFPWLGENYIQLAHLVATPMFWFPFWQTATPPQREELRQRTGLFLSGPAASRTGTVYTLP